MEARIAMSEIFKVVPHIMKLSQKHVWFDFDREADVLYVNFDKPQQATDSELSENDIILRYKNKTLIGLTVLHAAKRLKK